MTADLAPDWNSSEFRAHIDALLQCRDEILLGRDRLQKHLALGGLLRSLRLERGDGRRELPEVGGEHPILTLAQRPRDVGRPVDRRERGEGVRLRGRERNPPPQRLDAGGGERVFRRDEVGLGGGAIEFDENVAFLDQTAVGRPNGRNLSRIERLDHLDTASRLKLTLRRGDDVDAAEIGPPQADNDECANDPQESQMNRRGRRLQDFQDGRKELPVGQFAAERRRKDEGARLAPSGVGRGRSFSGLGPRPRRVGSRFRWRTASVRLPSRRELDRLGLQPPKISVEAARTPDQFLVRTDFDDASVLHPDDAVAAAHRRQPVGDDDHGAVLHDAAHVALDDALALVIERRRCFVEDEDARIGGERPGDGDPLPLSARQIGAALLDHGVVAFRQLVDEFVGSGEASDLDDLRARHGRIGEGDVLVNGAVEQQVLLQNDADMAAQPGRIDLAQIRAVEKDLSLGRRVESLDELAQRRLARAGRADDADRLARPDGQRDVLENVGADRPIAETDITDIRWRRAEWAAPDALAATAPARC